MRRKHTHNLYYACIFFYSETVIADDLVFVPAVVSLLLCSRGALTTHAPLQDSSINGMWTTFQAILPPMYMHMTPHLVNMHRCRQKPFFIRQNTTTTVDGPSRSKEPRPFFFLKDNTVGGLKGLYVAHQSQTRTTSPTSLSLF